MDLKDAVHEVLSPYVSGAGFFLEDVSITSAGKKRNITCVIDGETDLSMDEIATISKGIGEILDTAPFLGETPFTLEVTSPGIDRPLTLQRHWNKNIDRLAKAVMVNGEVINGRIDTVHDESVCLIISGKVAKKIEVPFAEIKRATIEIEFNRKSTAEGELS
ncbi:MAG: ribosome maturation factor RimP [Actinomycetota bacterium]